MLKRFGLLGLLTLAVVAMLTALAYAVPRGPAVEPGLQVAKSGIVLDMQTRQPVSGAYVVVRWLEQTAGSSGKTQGQCVADTVIRTDEQGRYLIPTAHFPIAADGAAERKYFWDTYAYAPGYAIAGAKVMHPKALGSSIPASQSLAPILLTLDHSAPEHRVETLAETLSRFTCRPYANDTGPVVEQIYGEAYAVACLPEPNAAAQALVRLHDGGSDPTHALCGASTQVSNTR
jgi:hypothetical protein